MKNMPLPEVMTRIAGRYVYGAPRPGVEAVFELMGSCAPERSSRVDVAVVGTNGKTSVTFMLSSLITRAGAKAGMFTSPHLTQWTERVRVDGNPVSEEDLKRWMITADHAAARIGREHLRFFDLLTVAAAGLFNEQGCSVNVYEAGIGGRLDAVKAVLPSLTVLTSIGEDHVELLGTEPESRLQEKIMVAPQGSSLIHGLAGTALQPAVEQASALHDLHVVGVERAAGETNRQFNERLAREALQRVHRAGGPVPGYLDGELPGAPGRFEQGTFRQVPYVADIAHNREAWERFLGELPARRHVLVCGLSVPRSPSVFAEVLARHAGKVRRLILTQPQPTRSISPYDIRDALSGGRISKVDVLIDPQDAFTAAFSMGWPVAVFGSNFLLEPFYRFLEPGGIA